ncbi:MAG: M20/M25/M40 family metallo-hydrolase, partial [Halolamina sp.]
RGEDVLPHFERIRAAFKALEAERGETVTHPLYEEYPVPWPIVIGIVEAGNWASSVPSSLTAEMRFGVAPGETVDEVEQQYEDALQAVVDADDWLSEHPPSFERFTIQFEPAETDPDEPIVRTLQTAMAETGLSDTDPRGATYGADSRHYVAAGIPTVVFGPGSVDEAHFPNESIAWPEVEQARETITETAVRFLQS